MTKLTELKTLEDFKPEGKYGGVDVKGQSIRIPHWMLKQEAIKWIKHLKYERYKKSERWDEIAWIKHFFNIENKDLK
jgi:hypothetical protein